MSRYLFTVWPFVGHVNPFVSVATELRARGHDVAFYSGARAVPVLQEQGFLVYPIQHIDEDRLWNAITAMESRMAVGQQPLGLTLRVFRDWLAGTIPGQVADLEEVVAHWRPDVVVTETAMWGPMLVLWEKLQLPVAILSTLLGCLIPGPDVPPWGPGLPRPRTWGARLLARAVVASTSMFAIGLRRQVNRIRAEHSLPPMGCSVNAFTARLPLYLVPSIPELDYNRRDLPPQVHYVGPCIWDKPSQQQPPAWLDELPVDRPWVHVTEGTAHYQEPFVLRAAAQGLAGEPVQAILTTGPERAPDALAFGPLAPNIRLERWVSHSDLLPRCAAIVTTGGAGTVKAALHAGVPLVVVPTHWDKAENAQRVVEAGAGIRIAPRWCTPERLRKAVRTLLAEPRYRANAQRLARRLAETPGPPRAADLLIELTGRSTTAPAANGRRLAGGALPASAG